jgi:endogenous inhibitor of DNA gyrase (YacG/DUF329 family)
VKRSPMKRTRRGDPTTLRPKKCATCKAEFAPATGFQKFCGAACRMASYVGTFTCRQCGETFQRDRHSGATKFCSTRCANIATADSRRGKPGRFGKGTTARYPMEAKCAGCGEAFQKSSRLVRHCSRSCANRHRHRRAREARTTLRWGLTDKGESVCRCCRRPATHLHHIVPRSKSRAGREDVHGNGLPLCFACHRGWHDRRIEIPHRVLLDHEFAAAIGYAGAWWVERHYPDDPDLVVQESFDERAGRLAA